MNIREEASLYGLIVRWVIGLALLFGLFTVGYLKAWPTLRGMWFEGMRSGNEYISTQESLLFAMMEDYQDLETQIALNQDRPDVVLALQSQQAAILDRMKRSAATIEGHVPSSVSQFLATH